MWIIFKSHFQHNPFFGLDFLVVSLSFLFPSYMNILPENCCHLVGLCWFLEIWASLVCNDAKSTHREKKTVNTTQSTVNQWMTNCNCQDRLICSSCLNWPVSCPQQTLVSCESVGVVMLYIDALFVLFSILSS